MHIVRKLTRIVSVGWLLSTISAATFRSTQGQQAAKGISLAFEDLAIGLTALGLGYDISTVNARHFQMIPGVNIVAL